MKHLCTVVFLLAFVVPAVSADDRLWASQLALVAANAADAHSSFGHPEANPLLRGPDGEFGARGALIKVAALTCLLVTEHLVTRKHPSTRRAFLWINWAGAGGAAAVAARNYHVTP